MNQFEYFQQFAGYADYDDLPDTIIYEREGWKVVLRDDPPDQWSESDSHYFVVNPEGQVVSPPINLAGYAIQYLEHELKNIEVAKWKAVYDATRNRAG